MVYAQATNGILYIIHPQEHTRKGDGWQVFEDEEAAKAAFPDTGLSGEEPVDMEEGQK